MADIKFSIIDRRGTKADLMPHEAFALEYKINNKVIWIIDCYTEEEAKEERHRAIIRETRKS